MLKGILTSIIRSAGKKDYSLDHRLTDHDLVILFLTKSVELVRGFCCRLFVRESRGLLFIGPRCTIKYKSRIKLGRTVTIGRNVEINALSEEGVTIGNNVTILSNTIIECTGVLRNIGTGLTIGNNVGISQNCFIQVRGMVRIGNDVIIGPGVSIFSENHIFSDPYLPVSGQGESRKGVTIEDGAWIGSKAVILDGVRIGLHSIMAAGSIVNRDVPDYSVVGGVPAKILKDRISTKE